MTASETDTDRELQSAACEVELRREAIIRMRQRVSMQEEGAAALHLAEFQLHGALKRLDRALAAADIEAGEGASASLANQGRRPSG